jgi:hypothetical protein
MEQQIDGFVSVELITKPGLALKLTTPDPEPRRYLLPLDPVTGQALAFAILASVGTKLLPELEQDIIAEATKRAATDDAFLKSVGIADAERTMN